MKKIFTFLVFTICIQVVHAQLSWDITPTDQIFECDDNGQTDTDILNYIAVITATSACDPGGEVVVNDYADFGNYNCGDSFTIQFDATDNGCSTPLSMTITVDIDDTTAPDLNDPATDETEECDGTDTDTHPQFQNWLNNNGNADYDDECDDDNQLTWFNDYDISNFNVDASCDPNQFVGDIDVSFWVEDECGNSSAPTVATFTIEDTTDPSFNDSPINLTVECDGIGNQVDIQAWVDDYVANANVSDGCTANADLVVTHDWDGSPFSANCNEDIDVTFTVTDQCGNTDDVTGTISVDDTTPPSIDVAGTDLFLTCDPSTNDGDIIDWLAAGANASYSDICSPVGNIILTDDYDGTPPECSMAELITFTVEDECGVTETFTANLFIDDFDLPMITSIETSPAIEECDSEVIADGLIQDILDGILAAATAEDVNDCTLPEDLVWVVNPDPVPMMPTSADPNCPDGTVAGLYEFDVFVEDECGNQSITETIVITIEDTQPPQLPSNVPSDEDYDCGTDIPPPPDLFAIDACESIPAIFTENVLLENCDNQITLERIWEFLDPCGNSAGTHTQIITVDDQEGPEWIGDEEEYLPGDISLLIADCASGFTFANGYFENTDTGEAWPDFPLVEGAHFEDNCGGATFQAMIPPNEEFGEGITTVVYTVTDLCGNTLTHEFEVEIICSNCSGGGLFCGECEDSIAEGCFTCNVDALLNGFQSCTPEFEGGIQNSQPSPLCNGTGVPHNMSWFAFVAGGPSLCVTVSPFTCAQGSNPNFGLQSGVYDFCEDEGGMCLGGEAFCSQGLDPIDYEVNDLIVGNTYFLFVDGCNGAECDYEITIEKGFEFIIDTPEEVVVESNCVQLPSLPPGVYCPETELQFNIHHMGDSPSDFGDYDDPGPYDPELNATFFWTFDPEIEGMSDGEWNQIDDGYNIPPLTFDDVLVPTTFTICLTDIIAECDDQFCDECCIDVVIQPLPDEMYGPYRVCIEDLIDADGWDPSQVGDDPNMDGIEWLGPTNITLDQIEMSMNGILSFEVTDPSCGCSFNQTIEIIPIGSLEPEPVTLYMFDCQFRDEDGDPEAYEWIWPSIEFELFGNEFDQLFNLPMASEERDWDMERCDSLILVTVDTAVVTGTLTSGPCTPVGTEYTFTLDLEALYDNHPNQPEIFPNYIIQWVQLSSNVTVHQGPSYNLEAANAGMYIIRVEYFFYDGAYPDQFVSASCIKEFGPFDLESGTAIPPDFLRLDTVFCENNLDGHLFVINPFVGSDYVWTFPAGAIGVTNPPVNDTAIVDFTGYDFNANIPISVIANTFCGASDPVEIFVSTTPLPVPEISAPTEVCVNDLAEANFVGDQSMISSYTWSNANYINGNQSGPGPVNYSSSTAGTIDIELVVVDLLGCESEPVRHTVNVIPELAIPVINCSTTASSITFTWDPIVGATGYTVNVLESPLGTSTIVLSPAETSVTFDPLNILDEVEIEVIANGPPPCGDSQGASLRCQAQDCPDPMWVFNLWRDTSFCINAPIDPFSFDVAALDDGVATYSGNGVSVNGMFDPTSPDLVVGANLITMTYTYQLSNCVRTRQVTVTIYPTPSVDFTLSDNEICLGEFITIDDSNVDEVANWNGYDGGIINAQSEISWNTPGLKTIVLDVTAPNNLGNCMNRATMDVMVLDTVIFGPVTCIDMDLDFVHFDWEDAFSASSYDISYSINGMPPITTTTTNTEIIIDMLQPGDEVDITVTAVSDNSCPNASSSQSCIAVSCVPLIFSSPVCSDSGINFVEFSWQAVNGASTFDVYIDGTLVGNQDSLSFYVDGLSPGDDVEIRVVAINDLPCPDVERTTICTAGDCPDDVVIDILHDGSYCWEAGSTPIQLDVMVTGGVGGGTGEWNSPFVDANGLFTPDDNNTTSYSIEYIYTEGVCVYMESESIEIYIIPVAQVNVTDDDICVDEVTMVSSPFVANNGETPIWDFGTANVISGSGFGPYEISYSTAGTYDVSVSIDNNGCIGEAASVSIEVDPELIPPVIRCGMASNNTEVVFEWDPVVGVDQYEIGIDGFSQGTQNNTGFTMTGLAEGQTVEITLVFLSSSSCSLAPISFSCTASACPDSYFEVGNYDREICIDGSESSQQISIEVLDPPSGNGVGVWTGDGINSNGLFNPSGLSPQVDLPLTYTINYDLCSYDTTIFITLLEAPQITSVNPIDPDCYLTNFGEIDVQVTGGVPNYTYQVDNGAVQSSSSFTPINPGLHNMLVTDANGCTTNVQFDIIPAFEPPLSIDGPLFLLDDETGTYTLSTTAQNIGDVIWYANGEIICQGVDCDPIQILGGNYPEDFDLTVEVYFNEDCFIETTIRVDVIIPRKWYIPNVIGTTASNPEDQTFKMYVDGNISVLNVKIYDRWGELVHNFDPSNDNHPTVDLGWDGTWTEPGGGPNVIQGVYVYLISMEVDGRPMTEAGDVTVLR